jgi:hypothetical protein
MAKRTKYQATFENGTVLKRSTDSRTYTHAWLVIYTYTEENMATLRKRNGWADDYAPNWYKVGEPRQVSGFSGSEALAHKALAAPAKCDWSTLVFAGVAPAVQV